MEWEPVESKNLAAVKYDPGSEVLEVEFRDGSIYRYLNLSQGVYDEFRSAPSLGTYFNAMIRNKYPTSRL